MNLLYATGALRPGIMAGSEHICVLATAQQIFHPNSKVPKCQLEAPSFALSCTLMFILWLELNFCLGAICQFGRCFVSPAASRFDYQVPATAYRETFLFEATASNGCTEYACHLKSINLSNGGII
jgi:hypothetical protein